MLEEELTSNTTRLAISAEQQSDHTARPRSDSAVSFDSEQFVELEKDAVAKRRSSNSSVISKKLHKRKLKHLGTPEIKVLANKEIKIDMVRDMIYSIYSGSKMPRPGANKRSEVLEVSGLESITKVVCVFAGGLNRSDFISEQQKIMVESDEISELPITIDVNHSFIKRHFSSAIMTQNPGSKTSLFPPLDAIGNMRLSKKEQRDAINFSKARKIGIKDLLLTKEVMRFNRYPIHSIHKDPEQTTIEEGWVETEVFEHEGSHIFALDCEFCSSQVGDELTRVSIVDFNGDVIYDSFVQPANEIIDFKTKYSGVTSELLEGVSTTLQDVQQKIKSIVSQTDILIGHSLESDLQVLKIKHPFIVDTALCYHHTRGPPYRPGLRWLCKTYLQRSIQEGENTGEGHSSIEDALACLDLVKLKIQEGDFFGKNYQVQSVFEKINIERKRLGRDPIKSLVIEHRLKTSKDTNLNTIGVSNDDEVVEHFKREVDDHDYIIVNLRDPLSLEADKQQEDEKLNERLSVIYSQLPENTLFIILSLGAMDSVEAQNLRKVKREFQSATSETIAQLPKESVWGFDKEIELKQIIDSARHGIGFMKFKERTVEETEGDKEDGDINEVDY